MIAYYNKNTGELKQLATLTSTAQDVSFNNTITHMSSTNVQAALDELARSRVATSISYNNRVSGLDANNVQNAIDVLKSTLQSNFQAGVDAIYNACVAKGSTPASKSLSDVVTGIAEIPNYNDETYTFPAGHTGTTEDLGVRNKVWKVNAQNVYTAGSGAGYQQGYNEGFNTGYSSALNYIRNLNCIVVTFGCGENDDVAITIRNRTGERMNLGGWCEMKGNNQTHTIGTYTISLGISLSLGFLSGDGNDIVISQSSKGVPDGESVRTVLVIYGAYTHVEDTREYPDHSRTGVITIT